MELMGWIAETLGVFVGFLVLGFVLGAVGAAVATILQGRR